MIINIYILSREIMLMKSFYYVAGIVIIAFLISLNTKRLFSLDEISVFLTVIGLIYGLIAAFTINNAWERFSKIRDAIAEETSSLLNVFYFAKNTTDKKTATLLRDKLISYSTDVPKIEWKDYWKSEATHAKFREIEKLIAEMKIKTNKDIALYDHIANEMIEATSSRNEQLVLSQTRITNLQWLLNIFLSLVLVIGIAFLNWGNYLLSIFITTAMIIAILLILFVLHEIDAMKVGEQEVSIAPYYQLVRIIANDDPKNIIPVKLTPIITEQF